MITREEILETVEMLNNDLYTGKLTESPFEYRSSGWQDSAVYFMGSIVWTEEEDEREYTDQFQKEPLEDHLMREAKNILRELNKLIWKTPVNI